MSEKQHIAVLGGGPAGLAMGYFAKKQNNPFDIYEASPAIGGNCRTIEHNGFLFDTGAHRLHHKDPFVTAAMLELLGDDLKKIHAPSRIYSEGKFIDFPLTPFNLLKKVGLPEFIASSVDVIRSRTSPTNGENDFRSYALRTYGKRIANRFLLNYSEKLWGLPCESLSVSISGKRLKGLDFRTFVLEALVGGKAKTRHIDGEFYYPVKGIGQVFESVADFCGRENIHPDSRITQVFHNGTRVTGIELNGKEKIEVQQVVNSLPLSLLAKIMSPAPPEPVLQAALSLKFRNVLLVCFFIDQPSVSNDATIYFPGEQFSFTRVYEPRNRSKAMSPAGKTSLVAEIPCFSSDECWTGSDSAMIDKVREQLVSTGLLKVWHIEDTCVYRIHNAYPVLEKDIREKLLPLQEYFDSFENLHQSGRSGMFRYTHIHDMFRRAGEIINELQR